MGPRALLTLYAGLWWLLSPLLLLVSALHPRLRGHFRQRWTLSLPPVEPGAVVVHGASVGEGRGAEAILEALRRGRPELVLLRTATSDTGLERARGQHVVSALPFDHLSSRWVDRVRPGALVLVEAELWPLLLAACARRGVPVYRVNPRVGPGLRRLERWAPGLYRDLLGQVQSLDVGDPKLDAPVPPCRVSLAEPVLLGASLREGDAERLLSAWDALGQPLPLLLAPRHPRRFNRSVLGDRPWCRVGEGQARLMLLDTVGELASFYPQARVAYVGGGDDPDLGGHSVAEARAAGVPAVHGPHGRGGIVAGESLTETLRAALQLGPQPKLRSGAAQRVAQAITLRVPEERPHRPWLPSFWPVRSPRPVRTEAFVVSVGNLDSGGTGKTPVAAWLARRLGATIVSRGYGGGDEALMLRNAGLSVVVDPDRVRGTGRSGAEVVVLDDAFQHRRVHRDLDIVCVDGWHPRGGGVLPRGLAREGWGALARADLVWVTRGPVPATDKPVVVSRLEPIGWLHRGQRMPLEALEGPVDAFAGIARPGRLLQALAPLVRVESFRAFPDHHPYTPTEVASLQRGRPLVTTEKDLVRFPGEAWALVLELRIVSGLEHLEALLASRRSA